MTGTWKALVCIAVAVMFVVPVASVSQSSFSTASVDESVATDTGDTAALGDQVDQSQEQDDGEEPIYGGRWYAQSFTPSMAGLKRLELKLWAEYNIPWWIQLVEGLFPQIAELLKDRYLELPGDLQVALYDSEDGKPGESLTSMRVGLDYVPTSEDWLMVNIADHEVRVGEQYYIVCHTTGGDSRNCYQWSLGTGNPYTDGTAYSSNNGYSWNAMSSQDFCFKTYGEPLDNETPDGIANRWALFFTSWPDEPGNSLYHAKNCLLNHGWKESHVKMVFNVSRYSLKNAFSWLDGQDDEDDIILIYSSTHGGNGGIYLKNNEFLSYYTIDSFLNRCGAKIFYSVSACHSGSAITPLKKERRIIATACTAEEAGATVWFPNFLYCEGDSTEYWGYEGAPDPNGAFNRQDRDLNDDGWVSAEEAFPYAKNWTEKFNNEFYDPEHPLHPQIYDGVEGELLITQVQ